MQLQIFPDYQSTDPDTFHDQNPASPCYIETVQLLYDGFVKALQQYNHALRRLADTEKTMYPPEQFSRLIRVQSDHRLTELKYDAARSLRSRLIHHALKEFGDPRAQLEIDISQLDEVIPLLVNKEVRFSAANIWRHIQNQYGGENGIHESWKPVARQIRISFNLDRQTTIKRTNAFVAINLPIDSSGRNQSGGVNLYGSSRREYVDALGALSKFAEWADAKLLSTELQAHAKSCTWDYAFTPKEKLSYGQNGDLFIITYLNRFEFRFSHALAANLQLFLGTYSA